MNNILYVGKHALTWTVSRHIHQSWELIFCTGGSGEMIFDGRTLEYGVNDVAVVPPMVPHSNASREGFTNIHMNLTDPALTYTEPLIIRADSNGFLRDAFTAAFYYWSDTSAEYTLLPLYGQLIVAYLTKYRSERFVQNLSIMALWNMLKIFTVYLVILAGMMLVHGLQLAELRKMT